MGAHPMLDPDSTVRLVYEALSAGDVMTQGELCARTGRTQGSVCKAVQLLMAEGYARRAGTALNRSGRSSGKSLGRTRLRFVSTGKAWSEREEPSAPTGLELWVVMGRWARGKG